MKRKITLILSTLLFLAINVFGQFDVNINVTDFTSGSSIENADVTFNSMTQQTDASGNVLFTSVTDGTYQYSVSFSCYVTGTGSVTVAGGNVTENVALMSLTANDVFFFVSQAGPPVPFNGATVTLTGGGGYTESLVTGADPLGDVFTGVPYGEYTYTIAKDCYTTVSGSVTVDCNGGMGVSVFETGGAELTVNDVFFFVSQAGPPVPFNGATVTLTDGGSYTESLVTGADPLGDVFTGVPYGEYTYTIAKDCYTTVSGSVTVDCNGGMGVSVFATGGTELTANDVFFFVSQAGPPVPFNGAVVTLTDGGSYTELLIVGADPLGDVFTGVPYGEYTYTITKDCYETVSGSVTVDCNGGMAVSVFETGGAQDPMINDVFFFVSQAGPPVPFNGAMVTLTDGGSYTESLIIGADPLGDVFTGVPYGTYTYTITKDCYSTVTGTVTVDCNGEMGVSVFETGGIESNDVFFFVSQAGPPVPFNGAMVTLTNGGSYTESLIVGADPLGDVFTTVPNGEYTYTITKDCYETVSGSVTVDCNGGMAISVFETGGAQDPTINDVFFFVSQAGPPVPFNGAMVTLTDGGSYTESLIIGADPLGDVFTGVPYGTYTYTITKDCYSTVTGTVTVDCNGEMGVSVFETGGIESNDVFFFVSQAGPPVPFNGAMVTLTNGGNYTESLIVGADPLGDIFTTVPNGEYTYTITKDCYETVSGSVTVDCNGGMAISVFATGGAELTANDVFFFLSEAGGPPLPFNGATITLTDGTYNESIISGADPLGNFFTGVPYGEYSYTISKDCYVTTTGTVTVDCSGGVGVSIFEAISALTANDVFFFVSQAGPPVPFNGATVTLTNGGSYTESLIVGADPLGDVFTEVPYGNYTYTISKDCYTTVTGGLTVDCNGAMAESVFATGGAELTENDVFFFVSQAGPPVPFNGATVTLTNGGSYTESLITGADPLGDFFTSVPYGVYSYTISKDCYTTVTGSLTVDCNNGNAEAVFETGGTATSTTNDVFFFVSQAGPPVPFNGATVTLTDGGSYTESLVVGADPLGDVFTGVPFGSYTFTITKDCYETVSGSVTVDCNGEMAVSVFATGGVESTANDVFFFVSQAGPPVPFNGATVTLTDGTFNETLITGADPLGDVFTGVPYGEYTYTIAKDCYETVSGTLTVDCANGMGVSVFATGGAELTTNDVFFFVSQAGPPVPFNGATVTLTDGTFNETLITGADPLGDVFTGVPYGEYTYTIAKDCYETVTGTLTVDCANGMGASVFATGGAELTANDVFFFVSQAGPPVPFNGATVTLTDGTFNETLITGADPLGDVFTGVPYGEYTYTIAKDCYETVSGTFTVDCANGMGASVFATGGEELTANDVFFFIGSPLPLTGAIVTLTDGTFNEMIETGVDPLGDFFSEVPYGDYTYTIEKDCYETITGTVTVACNGTMGVEVIENPVEIIIDNTVTVVDNVVTANATGLTYQWTTCDGVEITGETNQSFTPTVSGDYAVIITDGSCSVTSECVTVTVVDVAIEPSLNLSFYPNPVQTNLIIDLDERVGDVSVQVFNIHGQLMVSQVFGQNDTVELNLSKLFSGTYILEVSQKEETFRSPIIKL